MDRYFKKLSESLNWLMLGLTGFSYIDVAFEHRVTLSMAMVLRDLMSACLGRSEALY